jgi:hypothetical protein
MNRLTPALERGPLRILYIGGWGRSGSTLLDRLIDQAPGFVSVGEMRDLFLRGCVENRLCGCGERFLSCPFWKEVGYLSFGGWERVDARRLASLRQELDRPWDVPFLMNPRLSPAYRARHRQFLAALAAVYRSISQVANVATIVDSSKIATYALLLNAIPEFELRVLHLVRDSRGVAYSWQKRVLRPDRPEGADLMHRYRPFTASLRYDTYNGLAECSRLLGIPYMRMRYEDLVACPGPSLARAMRFAGATTAPADDIVRDGGADLVAGHNVDGNPMRFKRGRINIRPDEGWRGNLPTRDQWTVTTLTAPFLVHYGYGLRSGRG